jgi:hypothetical protein
MAPAAASLAELGGTKLILAGAASTAQGGIDLAANNGVSWAAVRARRRIQRAKISTVCGNARRSLKFLQKPFDSPRGHSYIAPTVGVAALCGGKAIRFSRVSRAYASWPKGWGESGSVFLEAEAFAATIYLLFDNRIGRKRNVDGGVLADRS